MPAHRPPPPELVARVLEAPDDDTPRLVLADALLARGDPRGDLITLQCAIAADDHTRAWKKTKRLMHERAVRKLLKDHQHRWLAELGLGGFTCTFSRGFVEEIIVPRDFHRVAAAARATPFQTVELHGRAMFLALLDDPLSQRITRMDLIECDPRASELARLDASRITHLKSTTSPFERDEIEVIARWTMLEQLTFFQMPLSQPFFAALVGSSLVDRLAKLDIRAPFQGPVPFAAGIVAGASWRKLRSIAMVNHGVDDEGACQLAGSSDLAGLEHLNLHSNHIGDRGGVAIATSPHFRKLRWVQLSGNRIGTTAGRAFADPNNLPELEHLSLLQRALTPTVQRSLKERLGAGFPPDVLDPGWTRAAARGTMPR